jgi:hypothetical protein
VGVFCSLALLSSFICICNRPRPTILMKTKFCMFVHLFVVCKNDFVLGKKKDPTVGTLRDRFQKLLDLASALLTCCVNLLPSMQHEFNNK